MVSLTPRYAALPAALWMCGLTRTAHAQQTCLYFSHDATLNQAISGTVTVGYAAQSDSSTGRNATSPTITLTSKSMIGGDLYARNSSRIKLSGGSIHNSLYASDSSRVMVSGGSIFQGLFADCNSRVTIQGGSAHDLTAHDGSRVKVGGGSIYSDLYASDNSAVVVSSGFIARNLTADCSSTVTITGGSVGKNLTAENDSRINLYGGDIAGDLNASDSSIFRLFGTRIRKTLINARAFQGADSKYILYGTLRDGTSLNGKTLYIQNGGSAKVVFINAVVSRFRLSAPARHYVYHTKDKPPNDALRSLPCNRLARRISAA